MIARKPFHLSGLMANCQSNKNKDVLVHEHLVSNNIDFGIFTETWLSENSDDTVWCVTSLLQNCGFKILTSNQKSRGVVAWLLYIGRALRWTLLRKVNYHLSSLPFGGSSLGTSVFSLSLSTDHHIQLPTKSLMHSLQQILQSGSPTSPYNTKIQ